tara:strand:- start:32283 stop:33131 length:849 start_codon:yes stop_codon:yes gene_type:complete
MEPDIVANSTVSSSQSGSNDTTLPKETGFAAKANGFMKNIRSRLLPVNGEPTQNFKVDASFSSAPGEKDWRVKLSIPNIQTFNNSKMLAPLNETNGLTFPYTPTIILSHTANYSPISPVHNNYPFYAYNNSSVDQMTITGEFFVQNSAEGLYWISMLHYLRSVTKMFYGEGEFQGAPPPVVKLNGYGDYVFKNVPVVVTMFTLDMPTEIDYIAVDISKIGEVASASEGAKDNTNISGTVAYVPVQSQVTVTVQPIFSRTDVQGFSLTDFVNGEYISKQKGFI